jgi:SOS-response transcriptional repressor LexA/transcriptional regulator with XRE-family HTH domain
MKKKEKEETINDRVKIVRKALDITQQEFADKIKLKSGNTFSMIERGENVVKEQNVLLICTPNQLKDGISVNETWLRNGGDPAFMFISNPQPDKTTIYSKDGKPLPKDEGELVGVYRQLTKPNKVVARKQIDALLEGQDGAGEKAGSRDEKYPKTKPSFLEINDPEPPYILATPETEGFDNVSSIDYETVGIPYLGADTAAGNLKEMMEDPGERQVIYLPRKLLKGNPKDCFCLSVTGTSMTQADIADGDKVVFRLAEDPENGAIMLVSYDGKSTVKRIITKNNKVYLRWEDGGGKEIEVEKEGYRVLGRLLLILK